MIYMVNKLRSFQWSRLATENKGVIIYVHSPVRIIIVWETKREMGRK
jgi:hypothetical protein